MAIETKSYLTPAVAEPLQLALAPTLSDRDKSEFGDLLSRLAQESQALDLFNLEVRNTILPYQQAFSEAAREASEAQAQFIRRQSAIYSPEANNNLGLIIGRIRVALSDPNQPLPLLLKPLRHFALSVHPDLAPFQGQVNDTEAKRASLGAVLDTESETVQESVSQEKETLERSLHQTSDRVREFCEARATKSKTLALDYLAVLPDRVLVMAETYSQQAAGKRRTREFDEFTAYLRSMGVSDNRIKRRLDGPEQDVLRRYSDYLRFDLLYGCFQRGIVKTKPSIPSSLSGF